MRTLLFAALLSAPLAAQAQTPRDLAHLVWGADAPAASVSAAPTPGQAAPGGASAADLASLSWGHEVPALHSAAPDADAFLASGGTARDLARLNGTARGVFAAPDALGALFAARTPRPRG